jgi:hypothetical protein
VRLFHFSDDPAIARFAPRPVTVPSPRPPGREWLNGPLVWAIDEERAAMYLFPRDCPRILLWPLPHSSAADIERWWAGSRARMLAYVEEAWAERLGAATLHRYELPADGFQRLDDAGMWVSRRPVRPLARVTLRDLPAQLAACDVELRVVESFTPLEGVWACSLHASGLRLRNAAGWNQDANRRG